MTTFARLLSPLLMLALLSCAGSPEQALRDFGDGVRKVSLGHTTGASRTVTFPTAGVITVDVESFGGDVTVVGNPTVKQTTVTVSREGTHGFLRGAEGKASLEAIQATAEIVPGPLGPVLRVRTSTPDQEAHFQRAHVWIEGSDVDGVRVRTSRGTVLLKNVTGSLDVESTNAPVQIMTRRPLVEEVTVLTTDGTIDYRVNGLSAGLFNMQVIGGEIRMRCIDGNWRVETMTGGGSTAGHRMTAVLGENPTNRVVLRTTEGDLRIAVVPDPTAVGAIIVDP